MTGAGNPLDDWIATVVTALALEAGVDRDLVLDVARDVAHAVARPAAPLTAYLMGCAVGTGADAATVAQRIRELAAGWDHPRDDA